MFVSDFVSPPSNMTRLVNRKQHCSWLTFSGRSTHFCALKGKVEVTKVHKFVQSGI
jgi:hypothetical protein